MGYIVLHVLTYGCAFAVYYVGILVRYHAKFLRSADAPPLSEQLVAGIAFSFIAIAPLLPAINLTLKNPNGFDLLPFVFILVVVLQEGLVLHEKATAIVGRLVSRAADS